MSRVKISNAIRVLSEDHKGGVLAPTDLMNGSPVLESWDLIAYNGFN